MTAIETRGEISIKLGRSYVLRPSWEAVERIEAQTGKSLLELCDAASGCRLRHQHAAIIITECVKAQGRALEDPMMSAVTAERIAELVHDRGLLNVLQPLAKLLLLAVTGGYDSSGNPKAAVTTNDPQPVAD
jgi:hypothetical protein